ncbi:hypothetical protein HY442_01300 [Candidatus Parcubacteria bacterium]|nr:hypothetical protein [Candidatus Parcubacteria bacterium]
MPKRLRFNHYLSLRTILVCAVQRRRWLLQIHQQHRLPLGTILERHFVRVLNLNYLSVGSVLERFELRELDDHYLSF